jgi:hypothetical protein
MPLQRSEYSCPLCKPEIVQINANLGELVCEKGIHKWNDTNSFLALEPTMDFAKTPTVGMPPSNYLPMKIMVPPGAEDALRKHYGDTLDATATSILMQMLEGKIMIVGQTDLDRIGSPQGLGKVPDNGGELFGMIFALKAEVEDGKLVAEAAQRDVKAYEGMSPGRVVVDLGDIYGDVQARAQNSEPPLPIAVWVKSTIKNGVENNWF